MWSHRSHDPDKLVTIAQADFQFASLVMMESDGENDRNSRDNRNTLDNFSHESHVANSNDYDVEGSSTRNSATRGSRSSPQIKPEPSWLWTFNGRETVDLISDNDETKIKQEDVVDLTFDWVKMADDCIVLSDSEDDIETVPQVDYPSRNAHSGQIQEDASRVTHEDDLIALSRDNPGSREASSIFGNGTKPAKLGSFILQTPTTRPELTPAKRAEMIRRQQQLGVIFRNQGRIADGNAFGGFAEASSSRSATSGSSMAAENAGTFTDTESALDAEAVGRWKNAKQVYKRMKDQGTNYFEDDVIWGKAKKAENLRRQQAGVFSRAGSVSSDDEARETSESLFVPQGQPDQGRAAEDATAPDKEPSIPDILQADEAEENLVYDVFGAETTRPNLHGAKRSRQQDRDESMHTGMEALLSHESRKAAKEKKTRKRKAPNESTEKVKKPRTKKDTKGKGKTKEKATSKVAKGKRRATQSQSGPPLNAASSLLYNDIFEEANKNAGATPLSGVCAKEKEAALKAMLIDVPMEDLKKARSQKKDILESTKILGPNGRCSHVKDGHWRLKGMKAILYNHQVQGSAWMITRENGDTKPLGGLLSDVMGLGKTLMVLACMVANPSQDIGSRCTLIVCPTSLIVQWEQEMRKHVQPDALGMRIRHHSGNRVKGDGALKILQGADVVITTYDEIRKSYPKLRPPDEVVLPEQKRAWWEEHFEERRGVLHAVHWHRVVLDEAQAIKNLDSQTSIACRGLMAKHRWAVSATPIQNGIEELFPYFKLLRVQHTGDFETFKDNFCDRHNPDSFARLHAFLRRIMLRRTHADSIMGRPLVVLPRNSQDTVELEFSTVERAIYESVERRMKRAINIRAREGTLEKGYSHVLVMLLRLRQMTAHPFMLQGTIEELFEIEDIERLIHLEDESIDGSSRNMLDVMKTMIRTKADPASASPNSTSEWTPTDEADGAPSAMADTSNALIFTFRKFLRDLAKQKNWTEMKARSLCHKCRDVPDIPWVTDCYHLYCFECLTTLQQEAAARGNMRAACCECARVFQETSCCTGVEELEIEAASSSSATPIITNANRSSSRERRNQEKEALKWINFGGEILPSTKTAAVIAQIEEWQRVEPNKKIIIFSQFHILMLVLGRIFEQRGWDYVRYNGRMTQTAREKSIADFSRKAEHKIMIASLRAGGIGLNLTMASKVICVDLWWNSSVEQQAFCRVFRIGQESETFVKRFVVKNTVDERLQQMQKKKAEAIRQAIDDERMLDALSIPELMSLFGNVGYDEKNQPFILVDDEGEYTKEAPPTMLRHRFIVD